jgi:hypothetical protein
MKLRSIASSETLRITVARHQRWLARKRAVFMATEDISRCAVGIGAKKMSCVTHVRHLILTT